MPSQDDATAYEAVMVSMSKTKDGIKLVMVVHPNDDVNDLFQHPIGSRYQVGMVRLTDDNQIIPPQGKTEGTRAVQSAGMLCKNNDFIRWLFDTGRIIEASEEDAADYVCNHCLIQSRAELKTNKDALRRFQELQLSFGRTRP